MKLVVGLGNPGKKYEHTRHNVGFMIIDKLAGGKNWAKSKSTGALYVWIKNKDEEAELLKPQNFMNQSGLVVAAAVGKHKLKNEDIFIIHDDLDLKLGEHKIQKGVGPKDHKGILSIEQALGAKEFWRVRVGVDNRDPDNRLDGETYVLQKFSQSELKTLNDVTNKVINALT